MLESVRTATAEDVIEALHRMVAWVLGTADNILPNYFLGLITKIAGLLLITVSKKTERQLLVILDPIFLSPESIRAFLNKKFPAFLRNMGTSKVARL